MKTGSKKAFGIDISKTAVNFAELQKDGSQIKVLRYGNLPINGIVNNGVIQNPAALTKSLKKFKIGRVFQHSDAVLTICAEPVLLQILNLPDSAPGEVKKIIQNEVRQYAVLPLKNIEMDYCGLRSSDSEAKRALVGAGQSEYLTTTVKAIEKDNINVKAIEPAITAFIRACFNKVIRPAGKKNIMILLVRDDTLNLCVFEKQRLEFLRTKKFESDIAGSQQRCGWLKNEVESVLQFYELEKETKAQSWQIIIAGCPDNSAGVQIADEIRSQIARQDIEIMPFENSLMDVTIEAKGDKEISSIAVGAAMKLLDEGISSIRLNLLPGEIISDRKAQKELLIITNVAACLLVFMFMLISFLTKKSINVSSNLYTVKYKPKVDIVALVESKKAIDEKISLIELNNAAIEKSINNRKYHNWAKLLVELAGAMPNTVLMENLESRDDGSMKIEGLAINYESANRFVNLLEQSRKIDTASLVSANQSAKFGGGLIDYSIMCSFAK
ncbi:MAG: pilus assembly protein PilM [Sedimentisphaerales bacterium]